MFVEAVQFGFFSDEEVKKMSVKKITNSVLVDVMGQPMPNGLYDLALGPLDQLSLCKSCGLRMFHCLGHFGHIELVSLAYNPLLFGLLYKILQRTCFFCGHFRADTSQVEKCATQLELIMKGDLVAAKNLEFSSLDEFTHPEGSDGSEVLYSSDSSTPVTPYNLRNKGWTSIQFKEAMSVLNGFLRTKHTECRKCNAKNPTITKPVFGWIFANGASNLWRENVIRGRKFIDDADSIAGDDLDAVDMQQSPIPSGHEVSSKRKEMDAIDEYVKQKSFFSESLLPSRVRFVLKKLWENEARLCSFISDIHHVESGKHGNKEDYSMFFIQTLLVPPIKFRPPPSGGDFSVGHPQTILLTNVIQANVSLGNSHSKNLGPSVISRQWMFLQQTINAYFDKKHGSGNELKVPGLCQFLDNKEGIFRQKIMGKRVNFACRSVISPDPYLAVNEIGIPLYFALRLTYPEKVTPWNVAKLREAIVNGSDVHPGATHYIDRLSTARLPPNRKNRIAVSRKLPSSRGGTQADKNCCDNEYQGKVVCRHLQDGDVVLVNRQPTLHKPSLMAHIVRVLKGEKTIRMHYANCSTYNADFDGDEINVHFPQDEISRSEGYNIINANNQYIVPTRGDAKRGLIQDHIVSAVLLTKKDTFLTREEFTQLVYSSGVSTFGSSYFLEKTGRKISVVASEDEVQIPIPAVFKPDPRWTGKQVISTVLNHLTRGRAPFTIEKDAKIPQEYFLGNLKKKRRRMKVPEDNKMLIHKNELVHGVIDQSQFGNKGLVHMVHELYGSNTAGLLLSVFSRLFTIYLQMHGFTCGVDDLLVLKSCDAEKKGKLEIAENIGEKVHFQFIGVEDGNMDEKSLQSEIERMVHRNGESSIMCLDAMMISGLRQTVSKINRDLLHKGLSKPFPSNCVSLMTTSGAKGSMINFQQISSFLGQQELEGKRVPRMVSGKTLPCFSPWDWTPRAGGFIADSFLTGLRPQEFYFHCMAGREGLVDTAVKTSRSGYLQRCLIKSLESVQVCYDHTVRDSDGSIIQFCYGEDGVDVHQMNFLRDFKTMAANEESFSEKFGLHYQELWKSGIDRDIEQLPFVRGISNIKEMISMKSEEFLSRLPKSTRKNLLVLMKHKYLSSLAHPGEAVGVIAAQSVGEPSTQMTLNTFHLAGRGEMNVTLGIPRLQEILISASEKIRTPIMSCPLHAGKSGDDGRLIAARLRKVTVANVVEKMEVAVYPEILKNGRISNTYVLTMKLYDPKQYSQNMGISLDDCACTLETVFMREMEDAIQKNISFSRRISGITNFKVTVGQAGPADGAENEGESEDERGGEDDETGSDGVKKGSKQADDEVDYEDDAEEEEKEDEEEEKETSVLGITGEMDVADENENEEVSTGGDDHHMTEKPQEGKKGRRERLVKETDRAFFVSFEGLLFEARFRLTDEPHVLLAQIAEKVGEKVHIKKTGKIKRCEAVECGREEVLAEEGEGKVWALQASGVDFGLFRGMEEEVDVRYVYSNSIEEMLQAYGVEAARSTIVREVKQVFNLYGVSVDVRHLNLIADYMTHHGIYQGFSRNGCAAHSVSPFTRMTFETASTFILNAAAHREIDLLHSPSSRICLGLPVNMGTGCFDLFHKVDLL